jgi:hypothetical protein
MARSSFCLTLLSTSKLGAVFSQSTQGIVVSLDFSGLTAASSTPGLDLGKYPLERPKLKIAIRRPATAIECHDDQLALQKRSDVNGLALRIGEHDLRRLVPTLRECFRKATSELVDSTLDDGLALRRNTLEPGLIFDECLFQGHL